MIPYIDYEFMKKYVFNNTPMDPEKIYKEFDIPQAELNLYYKVALKLSMCGINTLELVNKFNNLPIIDGLGIETANSNNTKHMVLKHNKSLLKYYKFYGSLKTVCSLENTISAYHILSSKIDLAVKSDKGLVFD